MKPLLSLLAILSLVAGGQTAAAEPLRPQTAFYEGGAQMVRVQARNDVDRAIMIVRRRMGGQGSFVSAERLDEETFRIVWRVGNRIIAFRVNVSNGSANEE
jgi:hypothetical protein